MKALAPLLVGLILSGLLAGCAVSDTSTPQATQATELSGRVMGGQQPISGASIMLYAAGSSGNGSGAASLLRTPVVTGANGGFNITADYTCPSATTQVYLVSAGGNPGLAAGTSNAAAVMLTALGDCGTLSSASFIEVDEVTTVAAAWALAQFMAPGGASGPSIGAAASNATGLRNAFTLARSLADPATGLAPGAALPTSAATETIKLNTLANILAPCVNSNGGFACTPLFSATGVSTNTADAALKIARNPAANVVGVFDASAPQSPYQPTLSVAPHDWTMSITYTGGGLASPTAVGVDSTGSVWAANYFGVAATKLSPAGVPATPSGFADPALYESYGLTIDGQDSVWITNEESDYSINTGNGSVSKFSSTGQLLSGSGYTAGGIYFPYAIAADSNGAIWVADYGDSSATLLARDGTAAAGAPNGFSPSNLPLPAAVAIDEAHNAWFATQGSATRVTAQGAASEYPCCYAPSAIGLDPAGNVWVTDYNASALVELSSGGTALQHLTTGGLKRPESLAIDAAGSVWVTNFRGNSFSAFGPAGSGGASSVLSPALGFGLDSPLNEPFGIALDASGNVWVSNLGGDSLTQFVGLAAPIRTPLLGPPVAP